ncbi:MAG: DUF695 domain-containing protein [Rhodanobacter sp.]|nr:DUF695 domain-containing protein [Rhodanobacter sp.]
MKMVKWILVPMLLLPCFTQAAEAQWWGGETQEDGKPVTLRALTSLPDEDTRVKHTWSVVIIWTYAAQDDGKPTPEDAKKMSMFEEAVQKQLEGDGSAIKAIIRTGNGTRQWTYYVTDLGRAQGVLSKEMNEFKGEKIDLRFRPDSAWKTLSDVLQKEGK